MPAAGTPRGARRASSGPGGGVGRRGSQSPSATRGGGGARDGGAHSGGSHHASHRRETRLSTPGPGEYNQDHRTISKGSLQAHRHIRGHFALASRGTMTENETLEEEVAHLNARIDVLVRAGADYRERVDDLFAATKEEARKEAGLATGQMHDLQVLNERLALRLEEVDSALAQERLASQQLASENEGLITEVGVLQAQVEESRAAQRRVEAELEQTAHDQLEQQQALAAAQAAAARQGEECGDAKRLCDTQKSTIGELERQLQDAIQASDAAEQLSEDNTRLSNERQSLEELIRALQARNQELDQEGWNLRRQVETRPDKEEAERLKDAEAQLAEKLRHAEASNRVLLREADRKKQVLAETKQQLEESTSHCEALEERLSDALVERDAAAVSDALGSSNTSIAPLAVARSDAACDPCFDKIFESSVRDIRLKHEQLLSEHRLQQEQMQHDKGVDAQVRALCEELHDEVERLTDENDTLREGLQTIEATFGRFLPSEEGTSPRRLTEGGAAPPYSDDDSHPAGRAPPSLRRARSILTCKDAFVQTVALQPQPQSPAVRAAAPPPSPTPHKGPSVREAQLEADIALLKRQRDAERVAATEAFKQKIKEVLRHFGRGGGELREVRVEVAYPARIATTPAETTPMQVHCVGGEVRGPATTRYESECSLLRRRAMEADAAERRLEAAAQVTQQLSDENEDLKEHVRRLLSADPAARTVHALLATSIRSAEKRINSSLARFKNVLRNRATLVTMLGAAIASLSHLRDLAGEVHLWLRNSLACNPAFLAELRPRMDLLCDAVDETRTAHRKITSECLTPWEKQVAGIAADGKRPSRDVPAELRATEDLLGMLWVTFTMPKTLPGLKNDRRLYGPVSPQPKGHDTPPGRSDALMYAPTVRLGGASPEKPSRSTPRGNTRYARSPHAASSPSASHNGSRYHQPNAVESMPQTMFQPDEYAA